MFIISIFGPYTGDEKDFYSYITGPHWKNTKGYRVERKSGKHSHYFGGDTWDVPQCPYCNNKMHQIFTFDLTDSRLSEIKNDIYPELPLVSCLNCSLVWEPQLFKLNLEKKKIEIIKQDGEMEWKLEDDEQIPSPLPKINMDLSNLKPNDIPLDEGLLDKAFDLIGKEYICRVLGSPLYAAEPVDLECPCCKKEMSYIATISGEDYDKEANLIPEVDFFIGEMFLYFFLCEKCALMRTVAQST